MLILLEEVVPVDFEEEANEPIFIMVFLRVWGETAKLVPTLEDEFDKLLAYLASTNKS
jgi:hypothetical protein